MFNNICVRSGSCWIPSTWGFSGQFLRTTWRQCLINNINQVLFQFVQCITHVRRMRIFLRNSVFAPYNCLFRSHVVGVCVAAHVTATSRRTRSAPRTPRGAAAARGARLVSVPRTSSAWVGTRRGCGCCGLRDVRPTRGRGRPVPDVRILFQRSYLHEHLRSYCCHNNLWFLSIVHYKDEWSNSTWVESQCEG